MSPNTQQYRSQSECIVKARDHVAINKLWFTTSAFTADQIARLESLELYTEAHHQGYIDDPRKGMWCWFELVVLDNARDPTPRTLSSGQPMILLSHRIEQGAVKTKQQTKRFTRSDKLFSWLQPGNVIGVRVCARFANWNNNATKGVLTVNFSAQQAIGGGSGNQIQGPSRSPLGPDTFISFKNETKKDIKVRVTVTKDSGSEAFFVIQPGKADKWQRGSTQVAFVFRTDNNETLTMTVQPGKTYTIGGSVQQPAHKPVQNARTVKGTCKTMSSDESSITQSFSARFEMPTLGGRVSMFSAMSPTSFEHFTAEVTMSYAKEEDLTGNLRGFTCHLGLGEFSLKTDNNVTVVGKVTKGGPAGIQLIFSGTLNWGLSR